MMLQHVLFATGFHKVKNRAFKDIEKKVLMKILSATGAGAGGAQHVSANSATAWCGICRRCFYAGWLW